MSKTKPNRSFFKRFFKSTNGATALIFSFMAVPVMALAGSVVDYGIALRVKSELTNTLDAALLAATQAYALDESVDTSKIINDFVAKNYTDSGKVLLSTNLVVNNPTISDDGEMSAQLDVKVPTNFLKLVNFDVFDFSITSSARVGGQSLEVALVLDNTLSMKGARLTALKEAAGDLVNSLMGENGNDNVRLSLIPYADYVNIGTKNRDEPGLDIPADYSVIKTVPARKHCWTEYPESTRHCTPVKEWRTCDRDGVPYDCLKTVRWNCTGDRGTGVRHCEDRPASTSTTNYKWPGCMGSRPHNLNVRDEDYGTQGVPGIMSTSSSWCKSEISPVTRLTSDKDMVTEAIDRMKASRRTYIPGGLAWGWRSISNQAPFADGVSYNDDAVKKVIVLMTDGRNTLTMEKKNNESTTNHDGEVWKHSKRTSPSPVTDSHTAELCENIKAKDIIVYTVAFEVDEGSSVENLMRNCAGNGGLYFDADDSAELAAAFKQIAVALLNLRLSR